MSKSDLIALGQLRWSKKRTISGYDTRQNLVFIIKKPEHVSFLNAVIIAALKKINEGMEQERDHAPVQKVQEQGADARRIRRLPGASDAVRGTGQGPRNGKPEETAGTRPEDEEAPLMGPGEGWDGIDDAESRGAVPEDEDEVDGVPV